MNSKNKLTIGIAAVAVVLVGIYSGVAIHYGQRYLPHTTVLGVKISGQTQSEANQTLKKRFSSLKYQIKDGKKTVATTSGTKLGIRRSFTKTLSTLAKQQNQWAWLGHALGLSGSSAKVDPVINTKQLHAYTKALTTKVNAKRKASKDANMSFNKSGLQVTKEVYGNQLDVDKLNQTIVSAIRDDQQTVQVNQTYIKPAVTTKSDKFIQAKTKLQQLAKESGKVTVENHSENITKSDLYQWLGYNNGEITVDETGVKKTSSRLWVTSTIRTARNGRSTPPNVVRSKFRVVRTVGQFSKTLPLKTSSAALRRAKTSPSRPLRLVLATTLMGLISVIRT